MVNAIANKNSGGSKLPKTKYVVKTELSYPPDRIAAVGDIVDDIPLSSIPYEIEAGNIEEYDPAIHGEASLVMRFWDKDGNEVPNDGIPPEGSDILHISEAPADAPQAPDLMGLPAPAPAPAPADDDAEDTDKKAGE